MNDREANDQSERTGHDGDAVAEAAYRRGYQQGAAYVYQLMRDGLSMADIEKYAHSTISDWRYRAPLVPRKARRILQAENVMSASKRARESVGLTRQRQITNATRWYSLAKSFHAAAKVLDEHRDRIPSDTRPFALNAALSLELIFKAILAKKQLPIPDGRDGHDLRVLCKKSGVNVSAKQMITLELMTEELIWAARYPAPKTDERMDDYHDRIVERHVVRGRIANVTTVRANPETFPNSENCENIWNVCDAEFESSTAAKLLDA